MNETSIATTDKIGDNLGFIYFFQCTSTRNVKIGRTINSPFIRFDHINGMSPTALTILGYAKNTHKKFESELHERFRNLRIHGKREWFTISDELISFIKNISNQTGEYKPLPRTKKTINQIQIARDSGVSQPMLSQILSGQRRAAWGTAKKLALVTGVPEIIWLEGTLEEIWEAITPNTETDCP